MTQGKKILIVEDDSFLQGLVSNKFQEEGFEVYAAGDSDAAFASIADGVPSIILLDLLLPNVDGFEILEQLRKNSETKSTPVIVFSNLAEEKDIKRATELGANEFLVKSNFTLEEVVEKVQELLK